MKQEHIDKFERYLSLVYDTVYPEPETPRFHNPLIDKLTEEVIDPIQIAKDAKILDVGCGEGYWMEKMRERGYTDLTGLTMASSDADAVESKGFPVLRQDFNFIELDNGSLDFIFCRHALEHSIMPVFTLIEFNRLLKMDGLAYIEVPAENTDRKHEENGNHFSILGDKMWQALFIRAGFEIPWSQEFKFELDDELAPGIFVHQHEKFYLYILKKTQELRV